MSDPDQKDVDHAKRLLRKRFSEARVQRKLTALGMSEQDAARYTNRAIWQIKAEQEQREKRQAQSLAGMGVSGGLLACVTCVWLQDETVRFVNIFSVLGGAGFVLGLLLWSTYRLSPELGLWLDDHYRIVVGAFVVVFFVAVAIIVITS